jgi:hypothetical protein
MCDAAAPAAASATAPSGPPRRQQRAGPLAACLAAACRPTGGSSSRAGDAERSGSSTGAKRSCPARAGRSYSLGRCAQPRACCWTPLRQAGLGGLLSQVCTPLLHAHVELGAAVLHVSVRIG